MSNSNSNRVSVKRSWNFEALWKIYPPPRYKNIAPVRLVDYSMYKIEIEMVVRASKELPSAKGGAEVASTEKAPPSRRIESTNHGRDRIAQRRRGGGEGGGGWVGRSREGN